MAMYASLSTMDAVSTINRMNQQQKRNRIMKTTIHICLFWCVFSLPSLTLADIQSNVINYEIAGQPFQGYLSYDDAISGKRPGVVVVHEWWGHNNYARKRADMLAKLGYTAFALDMYGTGKLANHPDDAQKFMQATMADINVMENRFIEAVQLLKKQANVNPDKIAAIGYCFGGGVVLHMARVGAELAGVVSFHGSLAAKKQAHANSVKSKILVLNGADDPFVTPEAITVFKQEMQAAKADFELINYPGVKHSFTNPAAEEFGKQFNMPLAYNAEADKDSWQRMTTFFQGIFKPKK